MPDVPVHSILHIAHRPDAVERVSALVDYLEATIPATDGRIHCTSLPGYDSPGLEPIALCIVFDASVVEGDSGCARAKMTGAPTVWLGGTPPAADRGTRRPPGRSLSLERAGLLELVEDVAFALEARPRLSDVSRSLLAEFLDVLHRAEEHTTPRLVEALSQRPVGDDEMTPRVPELRAPELRALQGGASHRDRPKPPVSVPPGPVRRSRPVLTPPPVGAYRAVEVGMCLSECLYHELPLGALDEGSRARIDELLVALGSSWTTLHAVEDPDALQAVLEARLTALPPERRHLGTWYEAGFQLALACNLAVLQPGATVPTELSAARQDAWTAFARAASELGLPTAVVAGIATELSQLVRQPGWLADCRARAMEGLAQVARDTDEVRAAARLRRISAPTG